MRTQRQKKNNLTLILMLVVTLALLAVMFLWNPTEAKAAPAPQSQEQIEASTIAKQGTEAPDFKVEMFDGKSIRLSDLRGKVVLVNFWATWCPPCREELTRVQKEIIDRFAGQEFVFLPISRGEELHTVEAFRKRMGYTFPMGLDPDQRIFRRYATNYIPRNFLIDRDGKVVLASIGYDKAEFAHLIETIEKTINNK
ncbi:MAG: redoxin domain-containing protein [Alistipes sp.]|jgi:peroxiredoxin|nr:redoxin domain-containing protein [Alistipes sp.]